jgi:mRNA interferase MazF
MVMKRGEIWWASMGEPRGSEPGYRRPVVIVSSDEFNESHIQTLVCVTITSNLRLSEAPGNFKIAKTKSGLSKDAVVNISQIITLDKSFLTKQAGNLSNKQLLALNEGLKLVLKL